MGQWTMVHESWMEIIYKRTESLILNIKKIKYTFNLLPNNRVSLLNYQCDPTNLSQVIFSV
jgi:hypothetical protein